MKNYLLLLLTFTMVALVMSSCKKDDDSSDNDIIGVWKAVSGSDTNCDDPANNGDIPLIECNDVTMAVGCAESSYDFKSDGTFVNDIKIFIFGDDLSTEITGTYTVTGDQVELCVGEDCGTATIADGKMTVSANDVDTGCVNTVVLEKE